MKSEVFEEYIKIMKDNGLTKKAQRVNLPEKKKEDPAKLYESKEKDVYSKMLEEAHPNKVIFGPTYDPINALVENNVERQQIMLNIVNRNPTGTLDHKKYAETQLKLSLLKAANELNNQNNANLQVLANDCLYKLEKQASAYIIGAIAASLAILYGLNHYKSSFTDENISIKSAKAIHDIDEVLDAEMSFFEMFGEEFAEDAKKDLRDIKKMVIKATEETKKVEKALTISSKVRTAKEAEEFAKSDEAKLLEPILEGFKKYAQDLVPVFKEASRKYANNIQQILATKDKGFFTSLVDKAKVLRGGYAFARNKLDEISDSLDGFYKTLEKYGKLLEDILAKKDSIQQDLSTASQSSQPTQSQPTPTTTTEEKEEDPLDKLKQNIQSGVDSAKSTLGLGEDKPKPNKPNVPKRNESDERLIELLNRKY